MKSIIISTEKKQQMSDGMIDKFSNNANTAKFMINNHYIYFYEDNYLLKENKQSKYQFKYVFISFLFQSNRNNIFQQSDIYI